MAASTKPDSLSTRHRTLVMGCTMIATLMQALDNTIANVALPHMQGSLGASRDQITWVLTSYVIAAAIMTAPVGWFAARFGRKQFFLFCLVGFTITSMLCGLSQSLPQEVVFRFLQGCFGAALVPLSQAIMLDIYPPEQRGTAMAIWATGVMVGPILGPTLGGWLTDAYNWRWVFFVNLPVGILAMTGLWLFMPKADANNSLRFDWTGFAVLALGIGSMQMMLDRGQDQDWFSSAETWIEVIALVVMSTYFAAHTAMTPADRSFVDFRLFRNQNFVTGVLFIFIVGLVLYATRALIPTMLETLMNYPVATTGLVTAPSGAGTMITMLIVGRLIGKVDLRLMLFVGFTVNAASLWQMGHYTIELPRGDIIWPGVIQGIGMGLVFVPLSAATFATLSPSMRAQGTALFSLVRNIGSSIGISLVQTMLVRNTVIAHAALTERVTYANSAWHNPAIAGVYDLSTPGGAALLDSTITQQAAMIAYIDDFWLMLFLTVAVPPLLLLIRPPGREKTADVDAHAVMD